MKLLFVYNADSGILASLKDVVHKAVSPGTYQCNLCKITYGPLLMKDEWDAYITSLPYEAEFMHRDEFRTQYSEWKNEPLPALFAVEGERLSVAIPATAMNAAHTMQDLTSLISKFLESLPKTPESKTLHQCPVCGFHYKDEQTANACEAWCREYKSCNLEITAQAIENQKK